MYHVRTKSAVHFIVQVLRQPHHLLKRVGGWWLNSQPLVHGGFLKSWLSGGLHAKVLARVREIVRESTCARENFKIYVTG